MLSRYVEKHSVLQIINRIGEYYLTGFSCASTGQSNTFQGMGFHYRFSRGDRVQIISGKHKGATGTVDANVFQRSVDFPKHHTPCHHVLLDNHLVITINVNQVEPLGSL
ncbi:MAG: hypothetical protein CL434_06160 [Acidimicrobiaceae bacterium]|nr:hypothetical protein [Acidimicrobiaceae bacterium]